jgi:6,7-dimethyl-8-ribityllumazine synthase
MGTAGSQEQFLSAEGLKLAVVVSRYNPEIGEGLLKGALKELGRLGLSAEAVPVYRVPGAFELPLTAQWVAESQALDAVICLGAVIRGDTAHFDYVCQGATQGLMEAMLKTGVPMAFGLLTTDNKGQAMARAGEDEHNKGMEAARSAVEMAVLKKQLNRSKR